VAVAPATVTLLEGTSVDLNATITFSGGVLPSDFAPTWMSLRPDIATVTAEGTVKALRLGLAPIVVEARDHADTAIIDVRILFRSVSAGARHSCGVSLTRVTYCWGDGTDARLGTGTETSSSKPAAVKSDLSFVAVWAGFQSTCGLSDVTAYCWGANGSRQLGTGEKSGSWVPVPVDGNHLFRALTVNTWHACGIADEGQSFCWGSGFAGQAGNGTTLANISPSAVVDPFRFRSIDAGLTFTCAVAEDGRGYCWGFNELGQLGRPTTDEVCYERDGMERPCSTIPIPIAGDHIFSAVSTGTGHACALTPDGRAYCWGDNTFGQLGTGSTDLSMTPAEVTGGTRFASLTAGDRHTCGIAVDGHAYCWGYNGSGALGSTATFENCGRELCSTGPVLVTGGKRFISLSASHGMDGVHTCGVTTTHEAYCWGYNGLGQLGAGFRYGVSFEPLRVSGQP
jgi:alpha-tubulin suppressor-like RCC1 family protein